MSKKKTREEKIKLASKNTGSITYSFTANKSSSAVILTNTNLDYHKKELKKIITSAIVIVALNTALFLLTVTGIFKFGFLGY